MQTLTETTEINIFLHPDILGVMWPADARAFFLPQWTIPQLDKLSNWKTILAQLERAS